MRWYNAEMKCIVRKINQKITGRPTIIGDRTTLTLGSTVHHGNHTRLLEGILFLIPLTWWHRLYREVLIERLVEYFFFKYFLTLSGLFISIYIMSVSLDILEKILRSSELLKWVLTNKLPWLSESFKNLCLGLAEIFIF